MLYNTLSRDRKLKPDEVELLKKSSYINKQLFLPWMDSDRYTFNIPKTGGIVCNLEHFQLCNFYTFDTFDTFYTLLFYKVIPTPN